MITFLALLTVAVVLVMSLSWGNDYRQNPQLIRVETEEELRRRSRHRRQLTNGFQINPAHAGLFISDPHPLNQTTSSFRFSLNCRS